MNMAFLRKALIFCTTFPPPKQHCTVKIQLWMCFYFLSKKVYLPLDCCDQMARLPSFQADHPSAYVRFRFRRILSFVLL